MCESTRFHEDHRGAVLEAALLEAAWQELVEHGFATFTMDAVVRRAGTSRPVLYRRWSDRHDLVRAAISHAHQQHRLSDPDTGSLRGDLLALMREFNATRVELITVLSVHLAGYCQETGTSLADLRDTILGGRSNTLDPIYAHAVERGEIKPGQLTDRMQRLPFDLLCGELTMTLAPYPTKPLWRSSIPSSCHSSGADPARRQQRHSGHELSGHDRIHRATLEGCRRVVPVHDRLQQQCAQQARRHRARSR